MKIKYADIFLNVNVPKDFNDSSINIFFFHGFTGSSEDWKYVLPKIDDRFNKITVDLIGHGKSDFPNDPSLYSWELMVEQINKIVNHFTEEKALLVGYSMGGRAALCYSSIYPERVLGMVLESTSPGIIDKRQKEKRIKEDDDMAAFIAANPIEEFIDMWVNKEIFTTQLRFSEAKRREIKKSKLGNNRIGLANSLYGFGTGKMPYLYDQFQNIRSRILLLSGELDTKFTSLNRSIVKKFPSAQHIIIKNAGHTIHLEEPEKFIDKVNSFLKDF